MSLRSYRAETTPGEHDQAVKDAEARLGRQLTAGEKRIDIVAQDRDLKNGKQQLREAIADEQRRAVRAWVDTGTTIHLNVTDRMMSILGDLYDAGAEHATGELKAAGVDVAEA